MNLLRLSAVALCVHFAVSAHAAAPAPGLDSATFDPAVRVQDDLFRAVNGTWLTTTAIPADKAEFGTFIQLRDTADARVRAIVDELASKKHKAGSIEQKVGAYYASYLNVDAIDKAGMAPVRPALAEIDKLASVKELAQWQGRAQGRVPTPILLWVVNDLKNPTVNQALTWQGGLGLPDRDFYLNAKDERMSKVRAAYEKYLGELATLAGMKNPQETARKVMAIEQRIAEAHRDRVENRDPTKLYNPMTPAELSTLAPGYDWPAFLVAAKLSATDKISVAQPSTATAIAKLYAEFPLADWKAYSKLHLLNSYAQVLPKAFRDAHFAFNGQALTGATAERPRWQKGIQELNTAMGEAVGQTYVARHFSPQHKARMQDMVTNLLASYRDSIDGLTWMTPETKKQAQDKLSKYGTKIGYPDKWRDYSGLAVREGDAFGNLDSARRFEWQRTAAKAGKKVDRSEWVMTPQTVNAYYTPLLNEIVFPAAILEKPFFDMSADDAVNYGAIGAVIGHEISHGFDDSGSRFDGDGVLRNWWTDADRKAFEAVGAKLVAQFETYEPIPGKKLNGKLTLGENIADLSGLQIAYKAYLASLKGKPAPVINGYSGEQRFFLGWSQAWREKVRQERSLQLLASDTHAPGEFRANGAAINHDGFHQAFSTKPGDKMYKPENERVKIW
jgi:putative endopeptidase